MCEDKHGGKRERSSIAVGLPIIRTERRSSRIESKQKIKDYANSKFQGMQLKVGRCNSTPPVAVSKSVNPEDFCNRTLTAFILKKTARDSRLDVTSNWTRIRPKIVSVLIFTNAKGRARAQQ
jgi:hypothetical protein